ncbi:hypothetical protein D7V86_13845 [bacterium D16-51]|nr:hypothetical protein D7V96_10890 [bacterium D16-59]RKI59092.1 hypothetical protein D7V86_13845 [bacterium D16-51]
MGKVLELEQREQAGSGSYNRFEYQVHWIVCHIIGQLENAIVSSSGFQVFFRCNMVFCGKIQQTFGNHLGKAFPFFRR